MRRRLNAADIGRALNLSRQRVHVLMKRGMPVDSIEAARQWRAAQPDADLMKPDPRARVPADDPASHGALKRRLLAAQAAIAEQKAENAGGVQLPAKAVERGLIAGLQLLRGSIHKSNVAFRDDLAELIGEAATREVMMQLEQWWSGVYNAACDGILLGFQHECGTWGRDFHARWVRIHRGTSPTSRPSTSRARSTTSRRRTTAASRWKWHDLSLAAAIASVQAFRADSRRSDGTPGGTVDRAPRGGA